MNLAYLLVSFSLIIAAQPIPMNINIVEKSQLISSLAEISNRNCEECDNDYTHLGSECCDTAWSEYGVNCDELESIYFWDCSGCRCPGDEPIIDEDSCDGEWIEDIEWASCNQLNPSMSNGVSYCNDPSTNTDQCYTYTCYGGSYGSWNTCCGGEDYQIDNSYCEEIEVFECSDLAYGLCMNDEACEWVEDIELGDCYDLNSSSACYANGCDGWNNGNNYYGMPYCYGGTYVIDNSYCEEVEVLDCSDMNLGSCIDSDECEWVENIEIGNCSDINNGAECYATNQCSWYNAGSYGYWYDNCYGGTYTYDSSYCEEIEFLLGDINGDFSINVLDIIEVINLILEGEYNQVVDMNYDHEVNVLDIVTIVDIILGN